MPATLPTGLDHQQLIVQLQHGQEEAFKGLYDAFAGVTYRVCLRMLVSPEDAEEVLQDTFLRLEAQAHRYDPARGTVQTFVLTIAHHLCLERLRARRARPQARDGAFEDPAFDLPAPSPPRDPLDQARIDAALGSLPETDRLLLEGMFFGGYTHAELTARTGLPLGTVKSRLRRALLGLRERITP
ncbi:sigma-70 family RNA polymerase sigma factor [Deinococcus sp. Arct2-2]|uniref:RNA polymerase sigma factor n=1 Tax=Deinococcus sp. Arct2-2 TaxID=2568653 RepID=UPI0010A34F00|nr:sigma-70 family RNA polymerase sigma factor [Deinococcus sp. Arct2-2]THF68355.1 sigma-70 family RNA polymerase sigma factor [Deinococcus sp. Arct2-2]